MYIHKEGYKFIAFTCLSYAILSLLILPSQGISLLFSLISFVFFLGLVFFLSFFRVPWRQLNTDDAKIISPCDGKIVVVDTVDYPNFGEGAKAIQVSVFMHLHNVHINRMPISGRITKVIHKKGKFLPAFRPKSSTLNEHCLIGVRNDNVHLEFKQIAGAMAKRIRTYCKPGDEVTQSKEMGFILFGSRLDVFLPTSCKVSCCLGQKVKGGIDSLAFIE